MTIALRIVAALAALATAALVAAAPGCKPNEEIVCATSTENTGASCAATYDLCAGGTDRIECKPAGGGVSCACIESGTTKRSFPSNDACNVTPDTLKKRAAEGCGWKLEQE
ncbi:MAG: hypothetical protein JWP87_1747 [Labilithrix sp.]|nr:hypothetical protein [Labilithrix sp.]